MPTETENVKKLRISKSSKRQIYLVSGIPDKVEAVASKNNKDSFVIVNCKPVIDGKQYILNGTLTLLG